MEMNSNLFHRKIGTWKVSVLVKLNMGKNIQLKLKYIYTYINVKKEKHLEMENIYHNIFEFVGPLNHLLWMKSLSIADEGNKPSQICMCLVYVNSDIISYISVCTIKLYAGVCIIYLYIFNTFV